MGRPLPYTTQRARRGMERVFSRIEALIDRVAGAIWNPLYHVGTLQITLLVIIAVTGIYLTVFYRPGAERAFESVAGMSATWLGSLMRTVHRYASAALLVVALIHASKSLLRDQSRGPRWLPWVTGWLLFVLFWVIGVLGYWLVWDRSAQWLTEWAIIFGSGQSVITFFEPNIASSTYMFFVIILFLHVFLSVLILLWVLIHVIRIANVTIWAPRWILVASSVALAALAVLRPATTGTEADLSAFVGTVELDHWYLGFLPTVDNVGSGLVWGLSLALLALMLAVPWLFRGRRDQPAVVLAEQCNGNARCADVCPYGAIEMVTRDDDSGHDKLAVVDPRLCTSCGLCVGVCPTQAIQIPDLPTQPLRDEVKASIRAAAHDGGDVVAVFACARHAALGAVARGIDGPTDVADWPGGNGEPAHIAIATIACSGMVNSRWVRDAVEAGSSEVVALSCPADDCRFEQGPNQLASRMSRGWIARDESIHRFEISPSDRVSFKGGLAAIRGAGMKGRPKGRRLPKWFAPVVGVVVLAAVILAPSTAIRTTEKGYSADGGLRVGFVHGGEFLPVDIETDIGGEFSDSVSPEQLLGAERHPVGLRVRVDGELVLEGEYPPTGLRNEGKSSAVELLWVGSGEHDVEIEMIDDGETWQIVFDSAVGIAAESFSTILWDEDAERFEESP